MKYYIILIIFFVAFIDVQSQTFSFYRTSPEVVYSNDTFGVISYGKINNLTGSINQIRIVRTTVNYPQGWESCICDINQCHPTGIDTAIADYPPGISNLDIMLYAHAIPGTGYVTFKAEKVSNINERYSVTFGGDYHPVGIHQISSLIKNFNLGQNFPNPFNPSTKINFSIPKSGLVTLKIYNVLGKELTVLINEVLTAGEYEADFTAENLASGMYYYVLTSGDNISVKKMALVK